ncbi:MAG: sugar phosphate isomerase/epimerase family protein [Eubacteriales bacterium]|jgi:sugar phosphate isomerase/epimerase
MKIGIQLFSVKEALAKNAEGTLRKLCQIGFKYIEPFAHPSIEEGENSFGLGMSLRDAKSFLTNEGIKLAGCHYYYLGTPAFAKFCEYMAELGATQVGSGGAHFPGGREDVLEKCELMVKDAEIAKKFGLKYYYHNHFREYQAFEGELVIDTILNNTPSYLVYYQLDTFWAARGGCDPVAEMKRLGKRIITLHQKDFSKTAGEPLNVFEQRVDPNIPVTREIDQKTRLVEIFAEVGTGILPIQDYIDQGNKIGVEYMLLEQDKTSLGEMESVELSMSAFKRYSGIEWD